MVPVLIPVPEFVSMTTLWGPLPVTFRPVLVDAVQEPTMFRVAQALEERA